MFTNCWWEEYVLFHEISWLQADSIYLLVFFLSQHSFPWLHLYSTMPVPCTAGRVRNKESLPWPVSRVDPRTFWWPRTWLGVVSTSRTCLWSSTTTWLSPLKVSVLRFMSISMLSLLFASVSLSLCLSSNYSDGFLNFYADVNDKHQNRIEVKCNGM